MKFDYIIIITSATDINNLEINLNDCLKYNSTGIFPVISRAYVCILAMRVNILLVSVNTFSGGVGKVSVNLWLYVWVENTYKGFFCINFLY